MNAEQLWRQYNAFRKRKAAQFAPSIYRALQAQIKYFTETNDLNNLPTGPMQAALTELYRVTGRQWAVFTFHNVLKDAGVKFIEPAVRIKQRGSIGLNQEFVDAIIEFFRVDLFNQVTNITETTRTFIREQVEKGIQQQLSLDEIINSMLRDNITKTRAALIARTEVGKAANAAEQIGSDKTNLQTRKEWISVRDFRTRFDHVQVDGSIVPDGRPFNVGGYLMLRPGASKTTDGLKVPAKEVCNCRCCVGRIVLKDKDGLPLRRTGGAMPPPLPLPTLPKPPRLPRAPKLPVEAPEPIEPQTTAFRPAATIREAEERIKALGVREVNLAGLTTEKSNAVLRAFESESSFKSLNLSNVRTVNEPKRTFNAQYYNHSRQIDINIARIGTAKFIQREPYSSQLVDMEERLRRAESLRGTASYYEKGVKALKKSISIIKERIEAGQDARYWSMSSSHQNELDQVFATITHEIGHFRHYEQIGIKAKFHFTKQKSVTEYGETNFKEYLVEWYTYWRLKGEKGVPSDLLKLFKAL